MPRVSAENVRRKLIGQARQELAEKAGDNKVLSRSEQAKLSEDLQQAAEAARKAKGRGARIKVSDVVDAYASYVTKTLDTVNVRGKTWLSKAETADIPDPALKAKVLDIRAMQVSGVDLPADGLPETKLRELAARFISLHSDSCDDPSYDVHFPRLGSGEAGTPCFTFPGDKGLKLAKWAAIWFPGSAELASFDPQKHMMVAMRTTEDEEGINVAVMDRATGKPTYIGHMNLVDYSYELTQAQFEELLGPVSEFEGGRWGYDELDHYEIVDALVEGGEVLDIPHPDDLLDAMADDSQPRVGTTHPFNCTYGDSGPGPDLSIFGGHVTDYQIAGEEMGALFDGNRFNSKFSQAGLGRDDMRAVLDELVSMWVDDMGEPRSELNGFEFGDVNKLLDASGQQLGWEINFGDERGIIGGAVYLSNDGRTSHGFGS